MMLQCANLNGRNSLLFLLPLGDDFAVKASSLPEIADSDEAPKPMSRTNFMVLACKGTTMFCLLSVGSCSKHLLPFVQSSVVHVSGPNISPDFQCREHDEEDIAYSLFHNHFPHSYSARQCSRSCHCSSWNFYLFTGKTVRQQEGTGMCGM